MIDIILYRDTRQVYVAFRCTLILVEYVANSCAKLSTGRLVDAAGIDPKVLSAIWCSSFTTKEVLYVASLVLVHASHQLTICDFLDRDPGVRQNGIQMGLVVIANYKCDVAARCAL